MANKKHKLDMSKMFICVIILIICISIIVITGIPKDIDADHKYKCDVKTFNLNTKILIKEDGNTLYTAKGDIFRIVEDPLTLYDNDDKKIFYADDTYHLIKQDSHCIVGNGEKLEMVGEFHIFGNSYEIYLEGRKVAEATFNAFHTKGELCDNDGNIIANYTCSLGFNDYIIQTKENNLFSEEAILMIFASYYSDKHADNENRIKNEWNFLSIRF